MGAPHLSPHTKDTDSSYKASEAGIFLPDPDNSVAPHLKTPILETNLEVKLLLPKRKEIRLPTPEELKREYREDEQEPLRKTRTVVALINPFRYLADKADVVQLTPFLNAAAKSCSEIFKEKGSFRSESIPTIIDSTLLDTSISDSDVRRIEAVFSYREKKVPKVIPYTKPGKLEQGCCALLDILAEDKSFSRRYGNEVVLRTIDKLVSKARRDLELSELPPMPDLAGKMLSLLGTLEERPERYLAYDILEQIELSKERTEQLLSYQLPLEDLEHPSTFKNLVKLSEWDPHHPIVSSQQKLREELLSFLSLPPQSLFGNFTDLRALSKDLLLASSPLQEGKIGIEVEFKGKGKLTADPLGWTTGEDGACYEVRRDKDQLEYGHTYQQSLHNLYRFLRDNALHSTNGLSTSLHIHLDRQRHTYPPILGELLLGRTEWEEPIRNNDLGTHEVRGLIPPSFGAAIPPAPLANVIALLIEGSRKVGSSGPLLELGGMKVSEEQILWGHLCRVLEAPEARLAALKVLSTTPSLSLYNPSVVMGSYKPGDAIAVLDSLNSQKGFAHYRRAYELARSYVEGESAEILAEDSRFWSSLVYQREWQGILNRNVGSALNSDCFDRVREALDLLEVQESIRGFFLDELKLLESHSQPDISRKAKRLFNQWHGIY